MKKRILAVLLSAAMAASLLVACDGTPDTPNPPTETGSEKDTGSEGGSTGEFSVEPYLYYGFENANEGWKVVVEDTSKSANNAYDIANCTGSRTIVYGDMALANLETAGVSGQCIKMNRDYALDLAIVPTKTKEYTISFWVCSAGMADFAPTVQFGSNMAFADNSGNQVAWANFTAGHGQPFPIVWSRNEVFDGPTGVDCWPWMYQVKDPVLRGYKEWAMVTLVCTGEEQISPVADGGTTVGAKLYVDGVLKYDSQDNYLNGTDFDYTWDCTLAPDLMDPAEGQTFESYFGINYWDTMYKGYLDELYVFDKALSDTEVAELYALGDPSNPPAVDGAGDPVENETQLLVNGVGANNYTQGWWSTWSDLWEVPAGQTRTIEFQNYHTNLNFANYMNAAVILQSTPTGHSADATNINYAEGYTEYGVFRMDNYGWLYDKNTNANLADLGWVLENNWDFDTKDAFKNATHDAKVKLEITNNGTTADIVMTVTAADGTVYNQSYKNIAVSGPLYACLTVEKACIDILSNECK